VINVVWDGWATEMATRLPETTKQQLIFDATTGAVSVQTARKKNRNDFTSEYIRILCTLYVVEIVKDFDLEIAEKYLTSVPVEFRNTSAADFKSVYLMCIGWEEALHMGWKGFADFEELIRLDFKRGDCLLKWDVSHVQCYFQSYRDRNGSRSGGASSSGYAPTAYTRTPYAGGTQKMCKFHNGATGCAKKNECNMLHKCSKCGALKSHGRKDCPKK